MVVVLVIIAAVVNIIVYLFTLFVCMWDVCAYTASLHEFMYSQMYECMNV